MSHFGVSLLKKGPNSKMSAGIIVEGRPKEILSHLSFVYDRPMTKAATTRLSSDLSLARRRRIPCRNTRPRNNNSNKSLLLLLPHQVTAVCLQSTVLYHRPSCVCSIVLCSIGFLRTYYLVVNTLRVRSALPTT